MNMIVFWILVSLFVGSKTAGRTIRFLFGIVVFFWVVRILACFGLILLPVVLVIFVFSKVVMPFVTTFLRHFQ